jgi:hypothetical protein
MQTAIERRDAGQALALAKAGATWVEKALDHLRQFLCDRMDDGCELFTFEQFRIYAEQAGLDEPASINAWGALTKSAKAAGLCTATETFIRANRPESHARMIRVWRVA